MNISGTDSRGFYQGNVNARPSAESDTPPRVWRALNSARHSMMGQTKEGDQIYKNRATGGLEEHGRNE